MSMKTTRSHLRLSKMLGEFGFQVGYKSDVSNSFHFQRQRDDGLYEWIECNFVGRKLDAATCWIGVSTTRLVSLKRLIETELVMDVALNKERGWTIIDPLKALKEWESSVVEYAVPQVSSFAEKNCDRLLRDTAAVREAASQCLERSRTLGDAQQALALVKNGASDSQRAIAIRMAEWPGVMLQPDTELVYELACLLIVTILCGDKLPDPKNRDEMPLENAQLMQQIQLVADGLLSDCV